MDSAVLVAIFTGGTAVLAGWVTSLGNARAARVQVEASAQAQQRSQLRASRRTAYLELIEQVHLTGELYWRLGDVYAQLTDPEEQLAGIEALRTDLRDAFDPLKRCVRVIVLEGPAAVAREAEGVLAAARESNRALYAISRGAEGARTRFDDAHRMYRLRVDNFIQAARNVMTEHHLPPGT